MNVSPASLAPSPLVGDWSPPTAASAIEVLKGGGGGGGLPFPTPDVPDGLAALAVELLKGPPLDYPWPGSTIGG